jgi:hypothetical protein
MVNQSVNQLSQAAMAAALGISPAAFTKQKKRGMPVDSIESARAWRAANLNVAATKRADGVAAGFHAGATFAASPAAIQFTPGTPAAPRPQGRVTSDDDMGDVGEDFKQARTRREISDANMAEMLEAEARRDLIRIAAVKAALATVFATTRDAMLQIPARLAPTLAADADPANVQNVLHEEIHRALMHLSGSAERMGQTDGEVQ